MRVRICTSHGRGHPLLSRRPLNPLRYCHLHTASTYSATAQTISQSCPLFDLRHTLHYLPQYSSIWETSLSFGELPLTSCPAKRLNQSWTDYQQISPFVQNIHLFFKICHTATFTRYFCYSFVSKTSRQSGLLALPAVSKLPNLDPYRLILPREAFIVPPRRSICFAAIISAIRIFVCGFHILLMYHYIKIAFSKRYPYLIKRKILRTSER